MFVQIGKRYINLDRVQEITWYGTGRETTAHVSFTPDADDMLALHGTEAEALVGYLGLGATDVIATYQDRQERAEARYEDGRVGRTAAAPRHREVSADAFNALLSTAVADGTALPGSDE